MTDLLHVESRRERCDDAEPDARNLFVGRPEHVQQRAAVGGDAHVLRVKPASKMLGGASQIVSKIRVKCNGT